MGPQSRKKSHNPFDTRRTHKTHPCPKLPKNQRVIHKEMLVDDIEEVYLTTLEGLGSSYRMKGFFTLKSNKTKTTLKIFFEGVAFGGNYGGHNVNVSISEEEKRVIEKEINTSTNEEIDDLLTEIQRRLLNNEMVINYDTIQPEKPDSTDGLGLN
jgi:hypothetical protein